MAMFITVEKRGTDLKKQYREAVNKKTKKLKIGLIISTLVNIGLLLKIFIH